MKMIKLMAVLAILSLNQFGGDETPIRDYPVPPSVDISAIRFIGCPIAGTAYEEQGSGFLIGKGILATAYHVAAGQNCYDEATGAKLVMYYKDPKHDFALMTGPDMPTDLPYIKYACLPFKKGESYIYYGISQYGQARPIIRNNTLVYTGDVTQDDKAVVDFIYSKGMSIFRGAIAPGMSGGPVTDVNGYAVAVNNAGNSDTTLLFQLKDTLLCTGAYTPPKNSKEPV